MIMPFCVPEPENNKLDDEQERIPPVLMVENSSEEDNDGDDMEHDLEQQGYQPLPVVEYLNLTSDEEEEDEPSPSDGAQPRKLEVNFDLVRLTMENIKLDKKSIPLWAKEISDSAWNEVVQQTISGKVPLAKDSKDDASGSKITPTTSESL